MEIQFASGSQAEDFLRPLTENEAKGETASFILQSVSELAPHFVDKIGASLTPLRRIHFLQATILSRART
jgi:hypothetical protein